MTLAESGQRAQKHTDCVVGIHWKPRTTRKPGANCTVRADGGSHRCLHTTSKSRAIQRARTTTLCRHLRLLHCHCIRHRGGWFGDVSHLCWCGGGVIMCDGKCSVCLSHPVCLVCGCEDKSVLHRDVCHDIDVAPENPVFACHRCGGIVCVGCKEKNMMLVGYIYNEGLCPACNKYVKEKS